MQTELSVLVIVVLISLACANVEDFSEDALKDMGVIHPNVLDLKAKLINSHFEMELHKPEIIDGDTILFEPKSIPNQNSAYDHRICRKFHGININNGGDIFCRIKRFGFRVTTSENNAKTYIELIVIIQSPEREKGLVLVVPVLKMPAENEFKDSDELDAWTREARVGIESPIYFLRLHKLFLVESVTLNFDWLVDLLKLKIRDTGLYDPEMDIYTTRPLASAEDGIKSIMRVAKKYLTKKVREFPIFSRSFLHTVSLGPA